jgi:hypothetical protein
MESWRWSIPLWKEGVIASEFGGREVAEELAEVYQLIEEEEPYACLRPLVRHVCSMTPDDYLDAIAGDVLKGGPDPAFAIPISACIDQFAAEHGLVVARGAPTSIAQKAEAKLGDRLFAIALPTLTQASGHRVLRVRRELEQELQGVRAAIARIGESVSGGSGDRASMYAALQRASLAYTRAFEANQQSIASGDDDEGKRIRHAYVSVTGVAVPADAALRSSVAAARTVSGKRPAMAGVRAGPPAGVEQARNMQRPLVVIVIKELSVLPGA